jgi:deoxyadenosine/deoxycytidine kinase
MKIGNLTPKQKKFLASKRIGVIGGIGVGKSTFCARLADITGMTVIDEVVDPELLTEYCDNPKEHAFRFQTDQLLMRIQKNKEMEKISFTKTGYIYDNIVHGDMIYAEANFRYGNMTERQHTTYTNLFNSLKPQINGFDLVILLDVSLETSIKRIEERYNKNNVRKCERKYDKNYLSILLKTYKDFSHTVFRNRFPFIEFNWNNPVSMNEVLVRIYKKLKKTQNKFNKIELYL